MKKLKKDVMLNALLDRNSPNELAESTPVKPLAQSTPVKPLKASVPSSKRTVRLLKKTSPKSQLKFTAISKADVPRAMQMFKGHHRGTASGSTRKKTLHLEFLQIPTESVDTQSQAPIQGPAAQKPPVTIIKAEPIEKQLDKLVITPELATAINYLQTLGKHLLAVSYLGHNCTNSNDTTHVEILSFINISQCRLIFAYFSLFSEERAVKYGTGQGKVQFR